MMSNFALKYNYTMKKIILLLTFFAFANGFSQIKKPVKWTTKVEKISDTEFNLIINATIEKDWHVYSQFTPDGGALPIVLKYDNSKNGFKLIGKTTESPYKKHFNDIFEIEEYYFENSIKLTQKVQILDKNLSKIIVNLDYQACKDACINDNKDLVFEIPTSVTVSKIELEKSASKLDSIKKDSPKVILETNPKPISNKNFELFGFLPTDLKQVNSNKTAIVKESSKSLWTIFGLGFIGGLLALLTPCVFPLIPLTVSFFTKNSSEKKSDGVKKAVLYGFFILGVYLLLSIPFHLLDSVNPDILNEISTNAWLNLTFFVIFVFFSFSFFGFYELQLPSKWTNKSTQGENIGGVLGIFFMALTLAIVSFSCTGPILGSLLAGSLSANGGAWQLTAGMGGFGLALGLPFTLFALFPNLMSALPKSGGWLNTTKVILGFLEIALAFKFLSNADLVKHWGILKIEPFLIIWILIFSGLALYLFGKIKFPHDSPIKKLSFIRIAFGILVASFTVYLISGFRVNKETNSYYSLSLLSGLAPPVGYSIFYPNDCPNSLNCFKDLKSGINFAIKNNKPVMLDFTGYACVNCRKMEENIWSKPEVDAILRGDLVLISLYVDDKKQLPKNEQIEVERANGNSRVLENYGHKWAHFQTEYFQSNSQPYYVILNPKTNEILNEPKSYTPNIQEYLTWLQAGISNFKK
jgi:thiol:disulfide interchange protein